jgi:hypothetical protein
MRKLLYAFVFASILVLSGFTSFASENEPGDGGTVPTYEVWLPVVELPPLEVRYPGCPILPVTIHPADGEDVSGIIEFVWDKVDARPSNDSIVVFAIRVARDQGFNEVILEGWLNHYFSMNTAEHENGVYFWKVRAVCYSSKFGSFGPWSVPESFEIVQ